MVLATAVPMCLLGSELMRSVFWSPHACALCLGFQHPFVSKVTSNRALRELVAEAKAEVMEEIEESRDEAEEDDSLESALVSTLDPVLASLPEWLWWGKKPDNFFRLQEAGLQLLWAPSGRGEAIAWPVRGWFLVAARGMEKQ